jgi:molybdopterin-guanine dinucleotide biosynthesis protein A
MMETAVILAGGKSTRMGRDKALLDFGGEPLIARLYRILKEDFREVAVSTNTPKVYDFLGAPVIEDAFPGGGSLAGIHAGLLGSRTEPCFFAACDMPFVNMKLVRYLRQLADDYDLVVPVSRSGLEPLHSFYSRGCLLHIEQQLKQGNPKIIDFFPHVNVREVSLDEMCPYDPAEISYFNINTREEYELALNRLEQQESGGSIG